MAMSAPPPQPPSFFGAPQGAVAASNPLLDHAFGYAEEALEPEPSADPLPAAGGLGGGSPWGGGVGSLPSVPPSQLPSSVQPSQLPSVQPGGNLWAGASDLKVGASFTPGGSWGASSFTPSSQQQAASTAAAKPPTAPALPSTDSDPWGSAFSLPVAPTPSLASTTPSISSLTGGGLPAPPNLDAAAIAAAFASSLPSNTGAFGAGGIGGLPGGGGAFGGAFANNSGPGGGLPGLPQAPPPQAGGEAEWREYTSQEGRRYWHNTRTGASRWDPPPGQQPTPLF